MAGTLGYVYAGWSLQGMPGRTMGYLYLPALLLVPPVAIYVVAVDRRVLLRPRLVAACLAAVIGVATLLYLAIQTRQNTRAVRHAATRGVQEDANAWRFRIVENPEVAELLRGGLRDPDTLSPNDRYRFRMLLDALVFHWQHAYHSDEAVPDVNITRMLGTPGGSWYWSRAKDVLESDFIAYVDAILAAER